VKEEKRNDELYSFLLTERIRRSLVYRYGPLLSGEPLYRSLGFTTMVAFRQAKSKKLIPITLFDIAHKRGSYALPEDVAIFLAKRRLNNVVHEGSETRH
jgi:hypothetical protein